MVQFEIKKVKPVFTDLRGAIYDLIDNVEIKHVGFLTSKAGSVRGNHFHKKAHQFNYVLSGKVELIVRKTIKSEPEKFTLEAGDFVSIPAGVVHTMNAVEDSSFFDFNTESRADDGYESDTIRV